MYKQTKKAIEYNYQIFKYKSYRHLESKLKGKKRFCYSTIKLYDNDNPELIQYFMEINHSNWCNTIVYNGDRKNLSDINYNNDKIIDKENFRNKLTNYFNDKYPNTLTEVKEYCNIHFSKY